MNSKNNRIKEWMTKSLFILARHKNELSKKVKKNILKIHSYVHSLINTKINFIKATKVNF